MPNAGNRSALVEHEVHPGDGETTADQLFDALLRGLPAAIADMQRQLGGRDWGGLRETAHRLRGSTSVCGVPALHTATVHLHEALAGEDEAEISRRLHEFERQVRRLLREDSRTA